MKTFELNKLMKFESINHGDDVEYHFDFSIGGHHTEIGLVSEYEQHYLLQYVYREYFGYVDSNEGLESMLPENDLKELKIIRIFCEEIDKVCDESIEDKWSFQKSLSKLHEIAVKAKDKNYTVWIEEHSKKEVVFHMKD